MVDSTVGKFHFDELLEISKSTFGGEGRGYGGGLVGGDWTFGIVGYRTTAAGFNAFDFNDTGTEVLKGEFGFGGFRRFHVAEVVGCLEPLYLGKIALVVVQSYVNGFVDDGTCAWLGDGFHHFEVALKNEFNDFVIGRFEVGFFHEGSGGTLLVLRTTVTESVVRCFTILGKTAEMQ